eukprot:scaffold14098_cov157-Skeletonema_marinoi.AAC.3
MIDVVDDDEQRESFYATLILALLRLAVEVTLNPTTLLRHSSQRKRASFKEAELSAKHAHVMTHALPYQAKKY